jgi:hypothetical protein
MDAPVELDAAWRTDDFWVDSTSLPVSDDAHQPSRRGLKRAFRGLRALRAFARAHAANAAQEATDASAVRKRLTAVLDGGLQGHSSHALAARQQDTIAAAIRTACHEVSRARASNSRATATAALLLSLGLYALAGIWPLVVLRQRWGISSTLAVATGLTTLISLSVFFLPIVLRARNYVPRAGRWSRAAIAFAVFATTATVGLASLIVTLSIPDPGAIAGLVIAAPAPWCVLLFLIPLAVLTDVLWYAVHWPADPRSVAQLALLHALSTLHPHLVRDISRSATNHERRKEAAILLERAAVEMERTGTLAPSIGESFGPRVKNTLALRSKAIASGLRQLQSDILWPEDGVTDTVASLEQSLIDCCSGIWSSLESVPDTEQASVLRLIVMRALLSVALLAAAWLVPEVFSHLLSDTASNTLRLILIITAITSALAPRHTVATAADFARALSESGDRGKR